MAYAVEVQLHSDMASCPHATSSWKLVTTSNSPSINLIEEFPSKKLRLLEVECKDVLVSTHIEAELVVTMNWQPPPLPLPSLKHVRSLFALLPYILHHYDWEKDTIDGFKSKLQQYKKFEDDKWDVWVEDIFMFSYGNWSSTKSIREVHLHFEFNHLLWFLVYQLCCRV